MLQQRCEPSFYATQLSDSDHLAFYWQVILQGKLTDLNNLIRGEDGQAVPQGLRKLIVPVLSEIDSWLNQGALMEFEAQMTLSNMAYNGPPEGNTPNQFSCKVQPT